VKCFGIRAFPAFLLLVAAAVPAGAQVKQHQATGTVAGGSPTQVVLLKQFGRNTTKWNFVVNSKTKLEAKPAKGVRVRIYYHEEKNLRIADRIRPAAPTHTSAPAAVTSTTPPPASSPKTSPAVTPQN
jgi:hypothetical protein